MGNRFTKSMASRADGDLFAVVTDPPGEWEPDAIAAARAEIDARGPSDERREELTAEVEQARRRAAEPLSRTAKLLCAIGGGTCAPGLIVIYLYSRYEKRGERRKAKELISWYACGLALHVMALTLSAGACR